MYPNYLKRESNPNKKWNLFRTSLEHTTLPLLAPRSTNWASEPLDTSVVQANNVYAVNVSKLLKKKRIQIKSEIWSVWLSDTRPYRC